MLDNSAYRVRLNQLRAQLLEAWSTNPLPMERIALIHVEMVEVLRASGIKPAPPTRITSDAARRNIAAGMQRRYAKLREEKARKQGLVS